MTSKKTLPTFTNAPLDLLPENVLAYGMRMEELDRAHTRATNPAQRIRIEGKMRELRQDLVKLKVAEVKLNVAAEAWWKEIEDKLREAFGPDTERPKAS